MLNEPVVLKMTNDAAVEQIQQEKRTEIIKRGLQSYPSDSQSDLARQQGIALLLSTFVEPPVIKLPLVDIKVRLRPQIGPQMAYYMACGDYEQNDLNLIAQYVRKGDRVLECGGGIGITGVMLAKCSSNPVTIIEPNSVLHPFIADTFVLNGETVNLIDACVVSDSHSSDKADFHVSDSYWWSSLIPSSGFSRIQTKALRISELIFQHEPSMLVIDVEGSEVDLLPATIPSCVRRILIELHTPSIGTEATAKIVSTLAQDGFSLKNMAAHSWFFER